MADAVPNLTLLIAGPFSSAADLARALRDQGLERSVQLGDAPLARAEIGLRVVEDASLPRAFQQGEDWTPALVEQIARVERAAVVDVALPLLEEHAAVVEVVRALRAAGGLALRMEGSGRAWDLDAWFECVGSGDLSGLHAACVVFVQDQGTIFTCGMHQLGLPDAEIAMADRGLAASWLETFQLFQLMEKPLLATGHTFRPDAGSQRRILERWPDPRHRAGDGRHNPFGLFRFLPEDAPPRRVLDPVPVIIPPLVAMLMAAERQKGTPLERNEVEAIAAQSPALMMELAHALELEKSRGYADIDPELAYEQWSIVREMQ
jgi:hypothetical protein